MANLLSANSGFLRDRDFFVHDGDHLRRFRISASIQAALLVLLFGLVAWSGYAAARLATASSVPTVVAAAPGYDARIASLAAETERRVKLIEGRQLALAAALAGEDLDAAALEHLGFQPAAAGFDGQGGPLDSESADPTFKKLFQSWKKLDNLHSNAIAVPSDKPVKTAAFTSGYGVRSDPFRARAAVHGGINLPG